MLEKVVGHVDQVCSMHDRCCVADRVEAGLEAGLGCARRRLGLGLRLVLGLGAGAGDRNRDRDGDRDRDVEVGGREEWEIGMGLELRRATRGHARMGLAALVHLTPPNMILLHTTHHKQVAPSPDFP